MTSRMTIGDFSRATHLSAKTLRFYHQARILEPAAVDPSSGYRLYDTAQVVDAQVVRHLRSLEVPVETVREILSAPGVEARNTLVAAHLESMEARLATTLAAVTSLRGLLTTPTVDLTIEHRSHPATPVVAVRETIDLADLGAWFAGARDELATATSAEANRPVGPLGGLWDTDLFLGAGRRSCSPRSPRSTVSSSGGAGCTPSSCRRSTSLWRSTAVPTRRSARPTGLSVPTSPSTRSGSTARSARPTCRSRLRGLPTS